MLISLVVEVIPHKSSSLPPTTGPAMHGLFFHWLASVDKELADSLHNITSHKPFTISGLQPAVPGALRPGPNGELTLRPDQRYWFRISSLDPRLSTVLIEKLYSQPKIEFNLLGHGFSGQRAMLRPEEHPWAAYSSFEKLAAIVATPERSGNLRLTLEFAAPTTFKSGGRSLPLPMPDLVWGSLASRWNSFAPQPVAPELAAYVAENMAISGYDIHTELALMEGTRQGAKLLAFKGWAEYTAFAPPPEIANRLLCLARFGFFSGMGHKPTQGFGQVRPVWR